MKLEIGYNKALFEVRKVQLEYTNAGSFSVAYLSDFHFTRFSQDVTERLIEMLNELNPDIVLLGGDYLDSKNGIPHFETFLKSFADRKNVFAVAGNHDYSFGLEKIEKLITAANINWIEKKSVVVNIRNTNVQIDGNLPSAQNKAAIAILCLHHPIDIEPYKKSYAMAFAGHLHGCQFVLWQSGESLYPGRLFYKWNVLQKKVGECIYYISKGLGDTIPARYNCKRDIVFVEVNKN